ncbi:MAG TPA: hypothetical protein VFU21_21400, partial [Kofleriaceae bacterium]|nr:hypothetical protein [Kofleriaceae bacterium]
EKDVSVLDVATGAVLHALPIDQPIMIACAPGARRLAVGTEKGGFVVDLAGAAPATRPLPEHRQLTATPDGGEPKDTIAPVPEVAFTRDGRLGASIGGDGSVRVWDAVTLKEVLLLEARRDEHAYATVLDFSPSGETILVGDSTGELIEWRVSDGKKLRAARLHRSAIVALRAAPDGSRIATASSDRSVLLIRQGDLAVERTIEEHAALLSSIDWSPDGQLLVTGSEDLSAFVWEASSGGLVGSVQPGGDGAFGAVFAGERIVAATRGGRIMSFPATRETRSPAAIKQILDCRLPFRLGGGGIERIAPAEGCR